MNFLTSALSEIKLLDILFSLLILGLYIFNIIPLGLPAKIGTREYISLIVFIPYFIRYYSNSNIYRLVLIANIPQIVFSIITVLWNGTNDWWYVQFALRNILYINGALLCISLLPRNFKIEHLMYLIILVIVFNNLIAAIGFVYPPVMNIITSIQNLGDEEKIQNTVLFANRMIGLGKGNYFVGGIISGFGIILTFYLLSYRYISYIKGSFIIGFLFLTGLFIARTTIVGFILGFILFVLKESRTKVALYILISLSIFFLITQLNIFENINTSHAFEIFTIPFNKGESDSLSHMLSMYDRKFSFSTLLIGDGLSKINGSYYMETDIGYLRNIFYFGLTGTIFGYLFYEFKLFKIMESGMILKKGLNIIFIIYLLALNFKGLPDYNFILFLFIAYYIRNVEYSKLK